MSKYDTQFKHRIVKQYLSGECGSKSLAKRHGLDYGQVNRWIASFRLHGIKGLAKKSASYDAQFKLRVVRHMERDTLSLRQTAARYDIRNPDQIRRWALAYHAGGIETLHPKPRGRPKQMKPKPPLEPPVDDDARTLEQLRKENEYLRAEVAYLKKLDALIRAKQPIAPKSRR